MTKIYTLFTCCLFSLTSSAQMASLVKDIYPGNYNSDVNSYYIFNGKLFFVANDGTNGRELWMSDGTTAGTQLVKDINPGAAGSSPANFFEFNNELYFKANDGTTGDEPWKTDGTTAGTVLIKDILTGSNGSLYNNSFSMEWQHNGFFYFTAYTSNPYDRELWKSDGTTAGTQLVKDINPGTGSSPASFFEFNNELYFKANDGTTGDEPWKTDGTTAGTVLLKDILPGNNGSLYNSVFSMQFQCNGFYYFIAATAAASDYEMWKSDGTTAGTTLVQDIYAGTTGSYPQLFVVLPNDYVVFLATDAAHGKEPWSFYLSGISAVENLKLNLISVYPNPACNNVNISFSNTLQNATVEIFNTLGEKVYSEKISNSLSLMVDVSGLPGGIYFINVFDINQDKSRLRRGEKSYNRKLIVRHD